MYNIILLHFVFNKRVIFGGNYSIPLLNHISSAHIRILTMLLDFISRFCYYIFQMENWLPDQFRSISTIKPCEEP